MSTILSLATAKKHATGINAMLPGNGVQRSTNHTPSPVNTKDRPIEIERNKAISLFELVFVRPSIASAPISEPINIKTTGLHVGPNREPIAPTRTTAADVEDIGSVAITKPF